MLPASLFNSNVAEAYGRGATYHTMEGFSRKLKAKAEARLKEMDEDKSSGSDVVPNPVKRTPKKPRATDGMFCSLFLSDEGEAC